MEQAYNIYTVPSVFLLEAWMPDSMVAGLNDFLDELVDEESRKSQADRLVGQISHGQQLTMDHEDPRLAEFCEMTNILAADYLKHFCRNTGSELKGNRRVEMDELWSVHSFERDYNPVHDHGTKTITGISCTSWTKVPQQILDQPTAGSPEYSLYNSSGNSDGCLAFSYGINSIIDVERLRPPQSFVIKPEVGKFLMFPSWLQHAVYPFEGAGERRTVAGNLNVWQVQENSGQTVN